MSVRVAVAFHGRFPDPRAAALFAAEEVKSFAQVAHVTLLVPERAGTDIERGRVQFSLPENVAVVPLATLELGSIPVLRHFAFQASVIVFARSVARYVRDAGSGLWVVTTDYPVAIAAKHAGAKVLLEIHDFPRTWHPGWRYALRTADLVLATNEWKRGELSRRFGIADTRLLVERNGVDLADYAAMPSRDAAREHLSLPGGKCAVYTGNLYAWKGVDTLAEAARRMPDVAVYCVGGSPAQVADYQSRYADVPNLRFMGHRPHEEVVRWQAAADVLVLPNTARTQLSSHYTSPMKLFEYMASGRPIVASRIPSVEEVVTDAMATLVTPDDPDAFVRGIRAAFAGSQETEARATNAINTVAAFTWLRRAERIFDRIESRA